MLTILQCYTHSRYGRTEQHTRVHQGCLGQDGVGRIKEAQSCTKWTVSCTLVCISKAMNLWIPSPWPAMCKRIVCLSMNSQKFISSKYSGFSIWGHAMMSRTSGCQVAASRAPKIPIRTEYLVQDIFVCYIIEICYSNMPLYLSYQDCRLPSTIIHICKMRHLQWLNGAKPRGPPQRAQLGRTVLRSTSNRKRNATPIRSRGSYPSLCRFRNSRYRHE